MTVNQVEYTLDIADTAGQQEYMRHVDSYMAGCEAFLVCYTVTSKLSLSEAG